jgi:hypothetical protein
MSTTIRFQDMEAEGLMFAQNGTIMPLLGIGRLQMVQPTIFRLTG